MNSVNRLITEDNWARIRRDYPEDVAYVENLDCDYDEKLDENSPGLKERINELVMGWLKATKQVAEKTESEKKYRFQIRKIEQAQHKRETDLQEQLRIAIQAAQEATQQAKSNVEKLEATEENLQITKQKLQNNQKTNQTLEQQLATSQAEAAFLKEKCTTLQQDLEKLQDQACVTADKAHKVEANISSTSISSSSTSQQTNQQKAVEILNNPKLIKILTHLLELNNKISSGIDATQDRIQDRINVILQAGKETKIEVQEAVVSTSKSVLEVAVMVAAIPVVVPMVLWEVYQNLNNWQLPSPRERFKKLCDSINCDPKNIKTIYPFRHRVCEPLNIMERVTGSYTKVADDIPYPTFQINQRLRKNFPDFSCTLLNEERQSDHRTNPHLGDCHSLEIINSNDLDHAYSIHDMHRYLTPNRVIKDAGCMTMQGLTYNVWGLGLQNVKEVYLLVRFPGFFSEMSLASLPSSLIQKLYRHSIMDNREGCGRDESYSVRDSYLRDIGMSYDRLDGPSIVYMYSVAYYSKQRRSLLNICELAIWEGIEVVGFIVHRHPFNDDSMYPNLSLSLCQPDDYFNWENIDSSERYCILRELLKAKDANFAQAFNQRFSNSTCFYLGKDYAQLQCLVSYRLHPNIQLKLDDTWKISNQHITSLGSYYGGNSSLTLYVTRIEKIFLILDTASMSSWEKTMINITVNRIEQNQHEERNREMPILKNDIDVRGSGVRIYTLVSLIGQSAHSHRIELTLPKQIKVLGFIMSGKDI